MQEQALCKVYLISSRKYELAEADDETCSVEYLSTRELVKTL